MGKYMKKSKMTFDVAVMEVSQNLGVRTRAKTLALQRINSSSPSSPAGASNPHDATSASTSCYLQLRSRRLEKPPLHKTLKEKNCRPSSSPSPVGSVCERKEKEKEKGCFGEKGEISEQIEDLGFEPSFGENNLDFEARDRNNRESTPSSLIRDSDNIGTPGSTTRRARSTASYCRVQNDVRRNIPTTQEMEEFFSCAEQEQQRLFIEKYNFDIVNDMPLPGRYEWVQIFP